MRFHPFGTPSSELHPCGISSTKLHPCGIPSTELDPYRIAFMLGSTHQLGAIPCGWSTMVWLPIHIINLKEIISKLKSVLYKILRWLIKNWHLQFWDFSASRIYKFLPSLHTLWKQRKLENSKFNENIFCLGTYSLFWDIFFI